jgi:hypothetical protein
LQGGGAKKKKKGSADGGGGSDKGVIHVVALASMTADSVSSEEGERERMYTLSQVFVCTLWRSNLAEIMHKVEKPHTLKDFKKRSCTW